MESIRDDAHLAQALAVAETLMKKSARDELSEGEEAYLRALADLVEAYEEAHVAFRDVSGVELLRSLMEENGLVQKDLAPIFGKPSVVSAVLSGKRDMTVAHLQGLAERFGLPAAAFLDRPMSGPDEPSTARAEGIR